MRQTFYEFCMLHERTNLLKEWDESRNFPLTPNTVSYGSKKKVWWTCENGHSWQTTVHVHSEGSGCPYCAGRKVLPGFNDLKTLCPGVAAQWHPSLNGALTPEMVTRGVTPSSTKFAPLPSCDKTNSIKTIKAAESDVLSAALLFA